MNSKWHNCATELPTTLDIYLVIYRYLLDWKQYDYEYDILYYYPEQKLWSDKYGEFYTTKEKNLCFWTELPSLPYNLLVTK